MKPNTSKGKQTSYTFVAMTLAEIKSKFPDPNTKILVSRKMLELLGWKASK